jgi:hypothetical protein
MIGKPLSFAEFATGWSHWPKGTQGKMPTALARRGLVGAPLSHCAEIHGLHFDIEGAKPIRTSFVRLRFEV